MRFANAFFKKLVPFNVYIILIIVCLFLIVIYNGQDYKKDNIVREAPYDDFINYDKDPKFHTGIVDMYYDRRVHWPTSNLGSYLFKNIPINTMFVDNSRKNKTFVVLIWKYWKWLENRHVHSFKKERNSDPLRECSVRNCRFTGEDDSISSADAVIVHVQRGVFPNTTLRNTKQRWVFLSDESPRNSFSLAKYKPNIKDFADIFNWSMTYRSDSDVPVPYGRTVALEKPILNQITDESLASLIPYWNNKRKDVLGSILISNCAASRRMDYLQELQEHLTVDIYGKCSKDKKKSCPGHFRSDCKLMSQYLFYFVFENSQCDEYLTEKSFYHAYSKGAIPVVMGPKPEGCEMLLPPDSFLHVDYYDSPKELAKHMIEISKNRRKLLAFHRWRNDFLVSNEHGYFGSKSYHYCRICEALNYNDKGIKYYDEESLRLYFDPAVSCR